MRSSLPTIILASTSPRRTEMLESIRMPFRVIAPQTEETPRAGEKPIALVRRLSREKAESAAGRLPGKGAAGRSAVVIAADTIVVAPGGREILGKPRDAADAYRMLRSLAGRTHEVHTGYCLLLLGDRRGGRKLASARMVPDRIISRVVTSRVTMRALTPADIRRYLDTGESMDKAGAYAAQGFGASLIQKLEGSYTNVVGLPLAQLLMDFEHALRISPFSWQKPRGRR